MDRKDKIFPKGDKKTEDIHPGFKCVVSEGSIVLLEARDLVKDIDTNSIKYYSWEQTAGIPIANDDVKDKSSFSFTAPYVKDSHSNTTANNTATPPAYSNLSFRLTITDNDGKTRGSPYNADIIVKRVHRAIIFQGGVALGAYEAGVYQAIVEKIIKNDDDKKRKGLDNEKRPLFDIVAGTSIGAMNGAIVVSSVTKNKEGRSLEDPKNWEDSAEKVIEFWRAQQQPPTGADILDINPFYHYWWDVFHNTSKVLKHSANELIELYSNINPALKSYSDMLASWLLVEPSFWKDSFIDGWYIPATAEAARRYYSAKQFLRTWGSFNVASGIYPWLRFGKFFDILEHPNYVPRPDNKHFVLFSLKRTLERFAHFPIMTSVEEKQPRLLLVTVDVKTGDAVTFDSYSKEAKYHDNRNTISNQDGIEIEHALASGAFPDFFDYPKFKINNAEMGIKNEEEHIFCDGGFRSNTPLREVLQAHRDYWLSIARKKHQDEEDYEYENDVPDLEIYIADLWPSELKEDPISFDRDFVENRKWDLILGDKTDYDEQVANVVTDYIDLARRLKNLAEQKGAKDEINYILDDYATSINTIGKTRTYRELLEGRFRLTKLVRIDHKDDGNEVNDKVFDYSYKTIENLMEDGYRDALIQMGLQAMKDEFVKLENKFVKLNHKKQTDKQDKDMQKLEQLEQDFQQIQQSVKIGNGHDATRILNRVEDFIGKVKSLPDGLKENNRPIKEEKALVIDAAKLLQRTIDKH
jgi:NTE family protein